MPGANRGGWFRLHRRALSQEDELWGERRPRTRWEAWVFLISEAAYEDHEVLFDGQVIEVRRGEILTSERLLMEAWRWGSRGRVRRFLRDLRDLGRIEWYTSHARGGTADHAQQDLILDVSGSSGGGPQRDGTTHGPRSARKTDRRADHGLTIIRLCNYESYQGGGTESGTTDGTTPEAQNGPYKGKKGEKNKETPEEQVSALRARYSPSELEVIDAALDAFRSTRKTGRMTDSIVLRELEYWTDFDKQHVIQALRTYVTKDYAKTGKSEKYARGILRGVAREGSSTHRPPADPSGALDRPTLTSWEPPR